MGYNSNCFQDKHIKPLSPFQINPYINNSEMDGNNKTVANS